MKPLNREKAISLIPAIVDGEATKDEEIAFFDFARKHPDILNSYQESLLVKKLLKARLKKRKAPPHLKQKIFANLKALDKPEQVKANFEVEPPVKDKTKSTTANQKPVFRRITGTTFRYFSAAAIVLIATLLVIQALDKITFTENDNILLVETVAAQHFISSEVDASEALFMTNSHIEAEQYFNREHGANITVPEIEGASLAGIRMAGVAGDYHVPILQYEQTEAEEVIYLFVFDLNDIHQHKQLQRHSKAAEHCKRPHDYYVAEIDQHHVVTWLWENNWYAAVSNHNGYDLAALVSPLNP